MKNHRNFIVILLLVILGTLALVGLTLINRQIPQASLEGNDFFIGWNTARLWVVEGIDPYDQQVSENTQRAIYGRTSNPAQGESNGQFPYPLFAMLFFAPFGPLDYPLARSIWMTLIEMSLGIGAYISIKFARWKIKQASLLGVIIFALTWYCAAQGVLTGQFTAINAVFVLGALILIQKKHDTDAGLLLAVSMALPQSTFLIFIFSILWALTSRRQKVAYGMLGGIAFLVVLFMVFLPTWPSEWVWQIFNVLQNPDQGNSVITVIAGIFPGINSQLRLLLTVFVIGYLLIEWGLAVGRDDNWFLWTALMTLSISQYVNLHSTISDLVVLLPIFFLTFQSWQERWGNFGQALAWIMLVVSMILPWGIALESGSTSVASRFIYLVVPATSILALWWVRWWTLRKPHLFYEEYRM